MHPAWYILAALSLTVFTVRKDLRWEMLLSGLFSLPALFIFPILLDEPLSAPTLSAEIIPIFSTAALAYALYKIAFRPRFSPSIHPERKSMLFLFAGFLLFLVLYFIARQTAALSLLSGLSLNLIIMLIWRRKLVWDWIFSSAGLGMVYLLIFFYTAGGKIGTTHALWFSNSFSGFTVNGFPLEELLIIGLFGAFWGPLYVSIKDLVSPHPIPHHPKHLRPKTLAGQLLILSSWALALWAGWLFFTIPQVDVALPSGEAVSLRSPIRIQFNQPVKRSLLRLEINPPVAGEWHFENSVSRTHLYRTVIFQPERFLEPGKTYAVTVKGIANFLTSKRGKYRYIFKTQTLPAIRSTSVNANQVGVGICENVTVHLDKENDHLAEFSFALEPAVEIETAYDGKLTYTLKPKNCLQQGQSYILRAQRSPTIYGSDGSLLLQGETEALLALTFQTKNAPGIENIAPQGDKVLVDSQIQVNFSEAMSTKETERYLSVTPAVNGTWTWQDEKTLVLKSQNPLSHAAHYALVIKAGLPDAKGGFLDKETSFTFSTIGYVSVSAFSPANHTTAASARSRIKVSFDQIVDHASAQNAFSLSPPAEGSFTWTDNTLIFTPNNPLDKDSNYQITVAAGVKSRYGLDSNQVFTAGFATEESVTTLNVPLDFQDRALSCEAASLKMALAYKGINVSEDQIMSHIGYDPTLRQNGVWGDPDAAFVGSIDGQQNTTGYGVNAIPIAKAANNYRRAEAFTGWSISRLAQEIAANNPVVIWGVLGSAYRDPWVTPSGKTVQAWKGEHARTVIGFTGKPAKPRLFIINDPVAGRIRWTAAQLRDNWAAFEYMGVAIY